MHTPCYDNYIVVVGIARLYVVRACLRMSAAQQRANSHQ